jgi:excisionase family DNA binding protein
VSNVSNILELDAVDEHGERAQLLLTPGQAADRLGVPVTDVRRWIRTEQCPVVRDGRKTRIPRAWVDELQSGVQSVQHPVGLDTLDDQRSQLRPGITTKRVGGAQVVVKSIPDPEPPPVNRDTVQPVQPELDAMDPLAYAAQLRAQAAQLIQQAAAIEHTAVATSTGADGRTRPTWDRFNNTQTEQQVRELRQAGQSVRDIADTLGCSRGTAHRIIRKLGL